MSQIPVYTAIRLIPREQDYLDRKSGSNGEIFIDAETNTLRVYDGKSTGGYEMLTQERLKGVASYEYTVTILSQGAGNKYVYNGEYYIDLTFIVGYTYIFNQNDPTNVWYPNATGTTNNQHPLNFSADDQNGEIGGGTVYTDNVVYKINNSAVSKEQYWEQFETATQRSVQITVTNDTPETLYIWCQNHLNMGKTATVVDPGTGSGGGGAGGEGGPSFETITVPGQNNIVADGAGDTLNIIAGSGIEITTNAGADTLTITNTAGGNVWYNINGDTGAAVPDVASDTLTIAGGTNITTAVSSGDDTVTINLDSFSIDFLSDVDTTSTPPTSGQVLKWDGAKWAPAADVAEGGAGLDAETLSGFNSSYYLDYDNLNNKPNILTLTALGVGPENAPSGNGGLTYNSSTGNYSYTPPDLSSYLTSVTFGDLTSTPTTLAGYGITDAFDGDYDSLSNKPTLFSGSYLDLSDKPNIIGYELNVAADDSTLVNIASGNTIQILGGTNITTTVDADGTFTINSTVEGGGGGEANQNAFSSVAVSGQNTIAADQTTDVLNVAGDNTETNFASAMSVTTNSSTDTLTLATRVLPAITMLTVTNSGATAYRFDQYGTSNNPTVYVINRLTIAFNLQCSGHPFLIQTPAGVNYNTGLVHVATDGTVSTGSNAQGKDSGTLYWKIPDTVSGGYRYQCGVHAGMVGSITVKDLASI